MSDPMIAHTNPVRLTLFLVGQLVLVVALYWWTGNWPTVFVASLISTIFWPVPVFTRSRDESNPGRRR